ncbi:MAG: T9SS C-terminal target domain-containing protein [Cryomorphaceae bacterium]|nr:MAG: T9SS C-terminal target domain-containing protein [Cryomorphaceae bacterium]
MISYTTSHNRFFVSLFTLLLSFFLSTGLIAQNEWTVSVWSNSWGDATTWQLKDNTGAVILSGGPYGNGYMENLSIETSNEPLSFTISSGLSDNTPYFSVWCDVNVVEGVVTEEATYVFSNLNCGVPVSEPDPTVSVSGTVIIDQNCNGQLDSDDIGMGGVPVYSSVDGLLGNSGQNGVFSFEITTGAIHEIYTDAAAGFDQTINVFVDATDTVLVFQDMVLSQCPEFDYHDLGITWSHTPNTASLWSPGQIKTFSLCVTNHGINAADGDLVFQITADPIVVVDGGGGAQSGIGDFQVVTFEVDDLAPQDQVCFEISLLVDSTLAASTTINVSAEVTLTSAGGLDYNSANNLVSQNFESIIAGIGNFFCDQIQSFPGFPADPACEAVVCAADIFCCTNFWDGVCASIASNAPQCADCLSSAVLSTIEGAVFIDYNCNGVWDMEDLPLPDVSISSSQSGPVANAGSDGFYSGQLLHNLVHAITGQFMPGFTSTDSYEVITPETSALFDNLNFGYCPVPDYYDLSLSLSPVFGDGISLPDNFQVLSNHQVQFEICVTNNGAWSALGSISLEADDSGFFTLVDLGGSGTVDANSVLWEDVEWSALETQCFIVEFVLDSDAGIGETVSFQAVTTLDGSLPADQVPENNISQTITITVGDLTGGPYCDQIQSTPGFPYDVACENIICATDPFCCNTQWDGFCASTAATEPLCIGCLESSNSASVTGNVFVDLDCDGIFGVDDVLVAGVNVFRNDQLVTTSNQSGAYSLLFPLNENVVLTLQDLPGFTVNEHNVYSDVVQNFSDLDFALCPVSDFLNLGVSITPIGLPPRPGFNHSYSLCIENIGSQPSGDYEVELDFSNMQGVSLVNDAGGDVSGTQITWVMSDLGVFEQDCFVVTFNVPPGTPPGTVMNPVLSVNAMPDPAADPYPENNVHSFTHSVVAAFDPNDKTVDQPQVNHTEIPDGEGVELEYLIRFQNTGNFFATFVRVEDELPDLLDLNSLEMIHSSHDYEIIFHEGQHIEWFFDNIMLPDSTTDEPGSHGHIHFRIKTVPGVQLDDVIMNKAYIFFDFKEPVITEYAVTTFMDCSEGSLSIVMNETACTGVPFTLTSNRTDFDDYAWVVNGQPFSGEELEFTASGQSVTVELTTTNAICTLSTSLEIPLLPSPSIDYTMEGFVVCGLDTPLEISAEGEVNWYLNDVWVAEGHTVNLAESGMYTLIAENECGVAEVNVQVQIADVPNEVTLEFDGEQLIVSPQGSSYMWFLDGLPFSQDGPAITPTESGEYSVIVYFDNTYCSLSSNMVVVSVSVQELLESTVAIYPNPATDVAILELPTGMWHVQMLDATGKQVRNLGNLNTTRHELNVHGLATGLYFVQVQSDEGAVVKKLVVR